MDVDTFNGGEVIELMEVRDESHVENEFFIENDAIVQIDSLEDLVLQNSFTDAYIIIVGLSISPGNKSENLTKRMTTPLYDLTIKLHNTILYQYFTKHLLYHV